VRVGQAISELNGDAADQGAVLWRRAAGRNPRVAGDAEVAAVVHDDRTREAALEIRRHLLLALGDERAARPRRGHFGGGPIDERLTGRPDRAAAAAARTAGAAGRAARPGEPARPRRASAADGAARRWKTARSAVAGAPAAEVAAAAEDPTRAETTPGARSP